MYEVPHTYLYAAVYNIQASYPIRTALISLILPIYRFGMVSSRRTVVECVNKTRALTLMLLVVAMVKSIPPSTFESLDSKSVKRAFLELVGLYQLAGAVATTELFRWNNYISNYMAENKFKKFAINCLV